MQAATRLQGHVVQGLAQAADASPGNVIGQANLASAAHFAMEVGHRIQDLFEKGDMSWTKRASGARGFGVHRSTLRDYRSLEWSKPEAASRRPEGLTDLQKIKGVRTNDTDVATARKRRECPAIQSRRRKPWEPPKETSSAAG